MTLAPSQKWLLLFGALLGFISVAAGAFGAHALKQRLGQEMLAVFEVGARYQMYHALAMFAAVWISTITPGNLAVASGWLFFIGTLIFSGSLYLLAMSGIRVIGAITPIGGVILLMGWFILAIALLKK
jgi:uncharacterized membrane protein YgdD (TMEM256/DUF423 family)